MASIATYDSRWLEGRVHVELTDVEVRVSGSGSLGSRRFETTIPLRELQPRVERFWIRSQLFYYGLLFATLAFLLLYVLVKQFRISPWDPLPGLALVFGIIGIFLMAVTFKQVEYAQFVSLGGVPELALARSGSTIEFEHFLEQVRAAIARSSDGGGWVPPGSAADLPDAAGGRG